MKYPVVMSEEQTLEAVLDGRSIARYGDGELHVAIGRKCVSQVYVPALGRELREVLLSERKGLLVGIPNVNSATPKAMSWANFATPTYVNMYRPMTYGSSFITRPDSAPWIDTPAYWERVRDIWRGEDVVLIAGDRKSIRVEDLHDARSVREIKAPRQHAYAEVDRIEEEVNGHSGPVILCLGCTATVLAARLERKGLWGIDLGHIGMFMRHAGIYAIAIDSLCSHKYRRELEQLHAKQTWGQRGDRHAPEVQALIDRVHAMKGLDTERLKVTVLDYGCGEGSLRKALTPHRVQEYDPGVKGKAVLPKPSDLVVCTDVMEHVEPKALDAVIDHLHRLTGFAAYVVIATRPANAVLPGGRNAHLIVENAEWWVSRFLQRDWSVEAVDRKGKEVILTLTKK